MTNLRTGGAATQTTAGTYAVTADFVPTDTANYTSLIDVAAGNFVITKATPTATLTVSNSPQTYTGVGLAATVTVTSSVPGMVTNLRTGGAATQTTAGTYAVTADFVPTDTTNYTSLIDLAAGNFVITKATPTATLTVTNSPQTYTGVGLAATVTLTSSVAGTVTNVRTGGAATQTTAGTYAVIADFVPTDTTNYTSLIDLSAGSFVIAKATPTATLTVSNSPQTYSGVAHCGDGHAHELGPRRGDERADRRRGDADDGGDLCGDRGLRADRHGELHLLDRPGGRELRDHQGDADGDADGEQFAADYTAARGLAATVTLTSSVARRGDERAGRAARRRRRPRGPMR